MKTAAGNRRPRALEWLCVAALAFATACGGGATPGDAGSVDAIAGGDSAGADGGGADALSSDGSHADARGDVAFVDAGRADAARDTGPAHDAGGAGDAQPGSDAGAVPACADGVLIDLASAGTVDGATTRYQGSNADVPEHSPFQPPAGCTGAVGYVTVLRYTLATRAHLRVSTDNAGTDAMFDTVVWVQTACDPAAATVLACNDDEDTTAGEHASALTTPDALPAGAAAYIVVAGFDPPVSPLTAQGAFELTVTEVPDAALGAACDPAGLTSACAGGARCASDPAQGAGTPSVCLAAGAWGGRCASGACASGLACDALRDVCVQPVADFAACDATNGTTRCADALSSCVVNAGAAQCVPDGAKNGLCRAAGSPCDAGLLCVGMPGTVESRCRTLATAGAACDPSGLGAVCAPPDACQTQGVPTPVCATRYAVGPGDVARWVDACAAGSDVALVGGDREAGVAAASFVLPFAFRFFGADLRTVWPAVDGAAYFTADAPANPTFAPLPDPASPALVAPWRGDLSLADGGQICVAVVGVAPYRRAVVEWSGARVVASSGVSATFEAQFEEGSSAVQLLYVTAPDAGGDAGSGGSVGVQSDAAREYALFQGVVGQGTAVRFVPRF